MAKIICENATLYSIRENCKDGTALICKPDCPICRGDGYTGSEPPKAERINTAREMIAAEIVRWDIEGHEAHYMRKGLRYALECLDKPSKPMVSVEAVIDRLVASWNDEYQQYMIRPVLAWLKGQEGK